MNQLIIDIRTLLLVCTLILVCRAALLAYAWAINRTYRPIRYWAIGSSLLALGVLLLSMRELVPLVVSAMLGQTAVIVGWLFTSAGTITATERVPPWRWGFSIAAAALIATFCLLLVWPDYSLRNIAVTVPGLLFDACFIYFCLGFRGGRWRTITFRILALALAVSLASSLIKMAYVTQSGSTSMFDTNARISQFYLLNIAILVVCTVLYVLLAEQESQEALAQEVEQRKYAEERIHNLVYYDVLTQLPNRRMLTERLDLAIATSKRSGMYGAVMLLDLDHFKPLNDAHGHAVGDLLLIEVAQRLCASVREIDTVSRLGGDEFVVVLSSLHADRARARLQALSVAEKIRTALAGPYQLKPPGATNATPVIEHLCSASIGVTLFNADSVSQNEIIKQADDAMYAAKESGRNSIRFFDVMPRAAA